MCQGATEVEEADGEVLSASEFVMKHVPPRAWEGLGVYPTESEKVADGIVIREVFLWNRPQPFILSIKPNEDRTINVEVFNQNNQDQAVYGRYLQHVRTLDDILTALHETQTVTRS